MDVEARCTEVLHPAVVPQNTQCSTDSYLRVLRGCSPLDIYWIGAWYMMSSCLPSPRAINTDYTRNGSRKNGVHLGTYWCIMGTFVCVGRLLVCRLSSVRSATSRDQKRLSFLVLTSKLGFGVGDIDGIPPLWSSSWFSSLVVPSSPTSFHHIPNTSKTSLSGCARLNKNR